MNHLQKQLSWGNLTFARENPNRGSIPVIVLGSAVTGIPQYGGLFIKMYRQYQCICAMICDFHI